MAERWVVTAKRADFQKISEKFHIDPVTARIIRNRDVIGDVAIQEFLEGDLTSLPSGRLLKDSVKAARMILAAVGRGKRVRIIGDYDIDGIMSTYLLTVALRRVGADVDTYLPDRVMDGYGIHEHLIRQAKEDGVDLLITCDNGISAGREIALAKGLGMQVIVTDHHDIPYQEADGTTEQILPPADAVINPKQQDCPYPFAGLCGAAVAYKLVCVLYEEAGIAPDALEEFPELVAFATVGDVADLKGENRILVKEGLRRLKHPHNRGLKALIQAAGLEGREITAYHIGYVLGPCINASGRMDTARRSLQLLEETDASEAARLAGDLQALNESRKALTEQGVEEAIRCVEASGEPDRVLVVYLPACHESIAGIIAGRLRERYYRPAFVLTKAREGVKGSGRSIEGYSMYDELVKCRDILTEFGGHPMAAGLSLEEEKVSLLAQMLNDNCTLSEQELTPKVSIDVAVPLSYLSDSLTKELDLLEPFGKGNPRPLFAQKNVRILHSKVVGKKRNAVHVTMESPEGTKWQGIYFGDGDRFAARKAQSDRMDIVYYPRMQSWRGQESLRIMITHYR